MLPKITETKTGAFPARNTGNGRITFPDIILLSLFCQLCRGVCHDNLFVCCLPDTICGARRAAQFFTRLTICAARARDACAPARKEIKPHKTRIIMLCGVQARMWRYCARDGNIMRVCAVSKGARGFAAGRFCFGKMRETVNAGS